MGALQGDRVDARPTAVQLTTASDAPLVYRSTDQTVLGVAGPALYEGVGPGTAHVIVELGAPGGRTESVELTVCSRPDAPDDTCSSRVPLVIRVVS